MHDITDLEARGLPGMFIASSEFEQAAAAQGSALGFHPRALYVPHPIQDRSDAEIHALADAAFEEIVAALRARQMP